MIIGIHACPFQEAVPALPGIKQWPDSWLCQGIHPGISFRIVPRFQEIMVRTNVLCKLRGFIVVFTDGHCQICLLESGFEPFGIEMIVHRIYIVHQQGPNSAFLHLLDKRLEFLVTSKPRIQGTLKIERPAKIGKQEIYAIDQGLDVYVIGPGNDQRPGLMMHQIVNQVIQVHGRLGCRITRHGRFGRNLVVEVKEDVQFIRRLYRVANIRIASGQGHIGLKLVVL